MRKGNTSWPWKALHLWSRGGGAPATARFCPAPRPAPRPFPHRRSLAARYLSVLPGYKLPWSLETIRSAQLAQGKSFLLPSRTVHGKARKEGGNPRFSHHCAGDGRREKGRREEEAGRNCIPNNVALDPSLQTYWPLQWELPVRSPPPESSEALLGGVALPGPTYGTQLPCLALLRSTLHEVSRHLARLGFMCTGFHPESR